MGKHTRIALQWPDFPVSFPLNPHTSSLFCLSFLYLSVILSDKTRMVYNGNLMSGRKNGIQVRGHDLDNITLGKHKML